MTSPEAPEAAPDDAERAEMERSLDIVFRAPVWLRREHDVIWRWARRQSWPSVGAYLEARFVERAGLSDSGAGIFPIFPSFDRVGRQTEVIPVRLEHYPHVPILSEAAPSAIIPLSGASRSAPAVDSLVLEAGEFFHSSWKKIGITFALHQQVPHLIPEMSARNFEAIYSQGGRRLWGRSDIHVDTLALICDAFPDPNYCHWLLDWIPRFRIIREIEPDFAKLSVVIPTRPSHFQLEILKILGISSKNILLHDGAGKFSETLVGARRVIGSSLTNRSFRHALHGGGRWAADFIRQLFAIAPSTPSLKLIIARKTDRNLIFDDITAQRLARLGFQTIHLETMEIQRQVELFSQAAYILAPHGAGLANIVFCQPATRILEVFPPGHSTAAYFLAAHAGNLQYSCAIGERPENQIKGKAYEYDIKVSGDIVDRFLSSA